MEEKRITWWADVCIFSPCSNSIIEAHEDNHDNHCYTQPRSGEHKKLEAESQLALTLVSKSCIKVHNFILEPKRAWICVRTSGNKLHNNQIMANGGRTITWGKIIKGRFLSSSAGFLSLVSGTEVLGSSLPRSFDCLCLWRRFCCWPASIC